MQSPLNAVTIDEVVAIAESFEASSAELYRHAATDCGRQEVRQTLLGLAEMEDNHLRAFGQLRRLLSRDPLAGRHAGREAELLEAWLGRDVFPPGGPPSEEARREQTVQGWLETAVGLEKESIAFYSGMRSLLAERHRGVLDTIIEEEVYHLASLSYLLRTLRIGHPPGLPT